MSPEPSPLHRVAVAASAAARQRHAAAWLARWGTDRPALVIAPTPEAGQRVIRLAAAGRPAAFGWQRVTLSELAARLAAGGLAARGLAPATSVVLNGVAARMVHDLRAHDALGRYAPVGERPGFPRALVRTFGELALAGVGPDAAALEPDLRRLYEAWRRALRDAALADRSAVLEAATDRARDPAPHPLLDHPTLVFDVALEHRAEASLVEALAARGPLDAVAPAGDRTSIRRLVVALGASAAPLPVDEAATALARLRSRLFEPVEDGAPMDATVEVASAPGESRECVEILRRVRRAAAAGVPFDRMAVLVHQPERYRAHLVEACRRAGVPAYFSRGTVRPDPTGRALLALLKCADDGLSARAFAEYLSLGAVPEPDEGGAPRAFPRPDGTDEAAWLPPEDELLPLPEPEVELADDDGAVDDASAVVRGSLRAPWRWERLLVDAAVIGGADRWRRRLDALGRDLAKRIEGLEDPDSPRADGLRARRRDLAHLAAFALPLLSVLEALPAETTWGGWIEALDGLARRAIRQPERVLSVLRELAPMAPIGPVGLAEVRLVLGERLTEMVSRPTGSTAGKLYVASTREARGLSFDRVFVPGLAEKVFPRFVSEDPIALDAAREALSDELATTPTRVERERLALRLAVGAAERALVLTYPRLDTSRGRPRVPSFYGLEVMRAIEGRLPSFEQLATHAEAASGARMAWPAPDAPADAIDGGEYDLAVLAPHLFAEGGARERAGAARYLLDANPHLARALRSRWSRWSEKWTRADGLVNASEATVARMAAHRLDARPYPPTALQAFAACPYRFYLRSILRLAPQDPPEALEELDPLVRGQVIHAILRRCLERLRARGALPVTEAGLEAARADLAAAIEEVEAASREELAPAIERVWRDAFARIRGDLTEWLERMAERPDWVPERFELSFGLPLDGEHDPASVAEPVALDEGLIVRGSIDLVERREGALRATDFKTGRSMSGGVIRGGTSLQPVIYARALETLFPGTDVEGGRLWFCTSRGGFDEARVRLGPTARGALSVVAEVVGTHLERAFLPAAPNDGECGRCDYVAICGPAEERRVRRKQRPHLGLLRKLRKQP